MLGPQGLPPPRVANLLFVIGGWARYTTFARSTVVLTAMDVTKVSYLDKARVLLRAMEESQAS